MSEPRPLNLDMPAPADLFDHLTPTRQEQTMNRVYTVTLTAPTPRLPERVAATLQAAGAAIQDVGGQSVSYRVTGPSPRLRDEEALRLLSAVSLPSAERVLATGMGVHRRVIQEG